MEPEQFTRLLNIATILALAVVAGGNLALAVRWHRRAADEHQAHVEAAQALDLMTQAQDPGREVHQRLAAAMESGILRSGGSMAPDPAGRRAAAMAMSAALVDNLRRANLRIVLDDDSLADLEAVQAAAHADLDGLA